MPVIRVEKTKNYTVMANYHLQDKRLSLKAKGLLSYMLSLPEEWDYSIKGLTACVKEGQSTVMSILKELKDTGYLVMVRNKPTKESGGRITWDYIIYETPQSQTIPKKQYIENQHIEPQYIENQSGNKIPKKEITKKQNTNKFIKPEFNEVLTCFADYGDDSEAEKFYDYYESKGWVVGKSPMKDWKACARNWIRNKKDWNKKKVPDFEGYKEIQAPEVSINVEDLPF